MNPKEILTSVGLIIIAALFVGSFAAVVTRVYQGGGLFYVLVAIACFAAAWVAGKFTKNESD